MPSAVLLVTLPVTFILNPVRPWVNSIATNLVLVKVPSINATIWAYKLSLTVFLTFLVISVIAGLVREDLVSLPVWFVIQPFSLVEGTVWLMTHATPIHHIVWPVALISDATAVLIGTLAMAFSILPTSKVVRLIGCLAEAHAMLHLLLHFSNVDGATLRHNSWDTLCFTIFNELFYLRRQVFCFKSLHFTAIFNPAIIRCFELLLYRFRFIGLLQLEDILTELIFELWLLFLDRLDFGQLWVEKPCLSNVLDDFALFLLKSRWRQCVESLWVNWLHFKLICLQVFERGRYGIDCFRRDISVS